MVAADQKTRQLRWLRLSSPLMSPRRSCTSMSMKMSLFVLLLLLLLSSSCLYRHRNEKGAGACCSVAGSRCCGDHFGETTTAGVKRDKRRDTTAIEQNCKPTAFPTGSVPFFGMLFAEAKVRRYQETRYGAADPGLYPWTPYFHFVGDTTPEMGKDDPNVFMPMSFCIPFFHHDRADVFVSTNGHLALSPLPTHKDFDQNYLLWRYSPILNNTATSSSSRSGSGFGVGEIPMIAPLVGDFNPSSNPSSKVQRFKGQRVYNGETLNVAIADYKQVELYVSPRFPRTTINTSPYNSFQAEFWENGTIIFRYHLLSNSDARDYNAKSFATGLLWSDRQKVVGPEVWSGTTTPRWAALRYDPYDDPCTTYTGTTCSLCAAANSSAGPYGGLVSCAWCPATSECMPLDVAPDVCPGDVIIATNTSTQSSASSSAVAACSAPNISATPQRFYEVTYRNSNNAGEEDRLLPLEEVRAASAAAALPLGSIHTVHWDGTEEGASGKVVPIALNFSFSFFDPKPQSTLQNGTNSSSTRGPQQRVVNTVYVRSNGTLGVLTADGSCGAGFHGPCGTEGLAFTIAPYLMPFAAATTLASSKTVLNVLSLPQRPVGSVYCRNGTGLALGSTTSGSSSNNNSVCPVAVVFDFVIRQITPTGGANSSFRVLLDANGTIVFHYGHVIDALANTTTTASGADPYYPATPAGVFVQACPANVPWKVQTTTPVIGLFRTGPFADVSSVIVPWDALNADASLTFVPARDGCVDCSGLANGYCNTTSRQCVCAANFAGESCNECKAGYYGPHCQPCAACANGGRCNDGFAGNGYCTCVSPYSGRNCTDQCSGGPAAGIVTCASTVGECVNGYCLCGRCVCNSDEGWYGERCDSWTDPCRRFSLDGCPSCVNARISTSSSGSTASSSYPSTLSCYFCQTTDVCIASPAQTFRIGNVSTCSRPIKSDADTLSCRAPSQPEPLDTRFAIITIIVVFSVLGLCGCITLMTICICRKRPTNPLVSSAVPGVPDFGFPRREREVIGISRMPVQGRGGRAVQGIPLKQIPLRDLIMRQREAAARKASSGPMHSIIDRGETL